MQVADALAVNQTTVSEWERNQTIPRVDDGLALAKLLGLDIDWLLYGDAHRLSSAPPEAA